MDRRAGDIPVWTKTCEPEDPTGKFSEQAVRERRTAVHERRTRWSKGFDFFNAKFGFGQAEHEYLMSLWWETEDDWTPHRRGARAPYGEKKHDLWNMEGNAATYHPQPPFSQIGNGGGCGW